MINSDRMWPAAKPHCLESGNWATPSARQRAESGVSKLRTSGLVQDVKELYTR